MIENKNKSDNGELHVCDFCGASPEDIWSAAEIDGQYCFEHFREAHENKEEFDEWCKRFKK